MIDINDELVKTGQVVHYSKGMQTAIDENGTKFRADLNDERFKSGKIKSVYDDLIFRRNKLTGEWRWLAESELTEDWVAPTAGKVIVKWADERNNNLFSCDIDDPLFLDGTYVPHNVGTFTAKDKDGKFIRISKDDKRYISGELSGSNKGMVAVKWADERNNDKFQVSVNDKRYISGELIPLTKGMKKSDETKRKISEAAKKRKGKYMWVHNPYTLQKTRILKKNENLFFDENNEWKRGKGKCQKK